MSVSSKANAVLRIIKRSIRRSRKWLVTRPDFVRNYVRSVWAFTRGDYGDLAQSPPSAKRIIASRIGKGHNAPWTWELPRANQLSGDAEQVHQVTGVWPLSYAYPFDAPTRELLPAELLSPLFPGHRYNYKDQEEYVASYRQYAFAMTHKKAGWDCFRHVEVMYSGGIPFMPDAFLIPPGTMIHYPKDFFARVFSRVLESGNLPPRELFDDVRDYFNAHLTTERMARYLMSRVGITPSDRVLFVDEAAVAKPDYTSNLTLIGLKQVMGTRVSVLFPTPYLYSDWDGNPVKLYGRGFGYSRVLESGVRTPDEAAGKTVDWGDVSPDGFDWVVVGSTVRNPEWTARVRERFPSDRVVVLHGEDTPPTPSEIASLTATGNHAFVREISREVYPGSQA